MLLKQKRYSLCAHNVTDQDTGTIMTRGETMLYISHKLDSGYMTQ